MKLLDYIKYVRIDRLQCLAFHITGKAYIAVIAISTELFRIINIIKETWKNQILFHLYVHIFFEQPT